MSWRALAAALAGALLAGCGTLLSPRSDVQPATVAADTTTPLTEARTPASSGVRVEIDAPGPLLPLLQRHLDLVRLGRMERVDVDDLEWSRLIDAAPVQVRALLETEGYFSPEIRLQREADRASGTPDLVRLTVVPGPRAQVTRLTLEVEGALERGADAGDPYASEVLARWRRDWAQPEGSEFRNSEWGDAKSAALVRLRAAGYAAANWSGTAAVVDTARNEVRLFLVMDSGPLFRFGRLRVEGLERQDLATVGHLASLDLGQPITETVLLDFQERLLKSGLFDSISVTLDADAEQADDARVQVRLREAPQQAYTFGVGVSANNGPRASVEHVHRRVFGRALTARNKLELASRRQAWDGELSTHTGPRQYRNLVGGSVERLEGDGDVVRSQRLTIGRAQDAQRTERRYFVEAERSLRDVPGEPRADTMAVSLNHHVVWRRLDNQILPTEGYTLSLQGGAGRSTSNVADTGNFGRAYGRLTVYRPLGRTWYGQARVEAGQVFVRDGVLVPESQLFRAGGDDSVRGYGYRSLGPQSGSGAGGGRVLLTGSVELARPILARLPSVWGAVFVDVGSAADDFGGLEPVWGSGVGVRWRSPVGPLRLDWAWGHATRKARLHFSVGIAF